MSELLNSRLSANSLVIKARWFYAIGFLLIGFISKLGNFTVESFPLDTMLTLFVAAMIINTLLFLLYWYLKSASHERSLMTLSCLQIFTDLAFLTIILYLAGVASVVPTFFFIPIVESIILFETIGPIVVAIWASIILFTVLANYYLLLGYDPLVMIKLADQAFINILTISIVYIIVGIFSSYIARLVKERGLLLARQTDQKTKKVEELEVLNRKLKVAAAELSAKDFALSAANKRLENLERAKSKFVSITTHQLRTPLAAIKWTFDMARTGQLGPVNDDQKN